MRRIHLLGSALLLLSYPQPVLYGQEQPSGPVIMAMGRGEIRLPPDVAIVRLVIASRASTAAAAATETARRVRAVTDTLRHWSLAPEITAPVALEVQTNEAFAEARLVDYEAKAVLTVRVRQFDCLGAIVDGALAAGATTVPGIRFESDASEAARMRALGLAYHQALEKAESIARAARVTLGPLVMLDTGREYDIGPDYDEYVFDDLPMSGTRTPRRDVPVSAVVRATWQLVPGGR